jgi:hypothetical protein
VRSQSTARTAGDRVGFDAAPHVELTGPIITCPLAKTFSLMLCCKLAGDVDDFAIPPFSAINDQTFLQQIANCPA